MNNSPIGIIDSGVGGLSVWQEIVALLPNESTIYLADQKNVPYGPRSNEEIVAFSKDLAYFLVEKNIKLLVVACNTISVTCLKELRKEFPDLPIVGTVPVIKTLAQVTKTQEIAILGTKRTIESDYLDQLINQFASGLKIRRLVGEGLVAFVEKGDVSSEVLKALVQNQLAFLTGTRVDALALACTHFVFLEKFISEVLGNKIQIFNSGAAVARQIKRILEHNNLLSVGRQGNYNFYTTEDKGQFQKTAELLLAKKLVNVYHADI